MTYGEKIRLIIAYILSAVLISGYFVILFIALHPKTSNEYRLFYLEHRLRYAVCSKRLDVPVGEKLFLDGKSDSSSTFYGVGEGFAWDTAGDDSFENTGFCYMNAPEADLYFTGLLDGEHMLTIHVKDQEQETPEASELTVRINDVPSEAVFDAKASALTVSIPESAADDFGVTKVTLCSDTWTDGDRGISIDYVRID